METTNTNVISDPKMTEEEVRINREEERIEEQYNDFSSYNAQSKNNRIIVKYVKDMFDSGYIGCVIAINTDENGIQYGWSRCRKEMGDIFNKKKGRAFALDRALNATNKTFPKNIPIEIIRELYNIMNRSRKYFKK